MKSPDELATEIVDFLFEEKDVVIQARDETVQANPQGPMRRMVTAGIAHIISEGLK
jgi:hypothetical protein